MLPASASMAMLLAQTFRLSQLELRLAIPIQRFKLHHVPPGSPDILIQDVHDWLSVKVEQDLCRNPLRLPPAVQKTVVHTVSGTRQT